MITEHVTGSGTQGLAVDLVLSERRYQDEKWGGTDHDDAETRGAWLGYITEYATGTGRATGYTFAKRMLKATALGLAALEACLRRDEHPHDGSPAAAASPRDLAYAAIDGERDYQDSMKLGRDRRTKGVGDYLTLIRDYSARADAAYTQSHGDGPSLHVIRKIAAICVQALEVHGAPRRDA